MNGRLTSRWSVVGFRLGTSRPPHWTSYALAHALATRAVTLLLRKPLDIEEFLQVHNCALYTGEHAEPEVRAQVSTPSPVALLRSRAAVSQLSV